MRGYFAPVQFDIDAEYLFFLQELKDWVESQPVCDSIVFLDDNQFRPIVRNNQAFLCNDQYPYAFIKSLPQNFTKRIYDLLPDRIKTDFKVLPDHTRIFCNRNSLDWHTDAPYRHRAVNIAVSDSLGDTSASYTVRNPLTGETQAFHYEYRKGYVVDISSPHKIDVTFLKKTNLRILISFSIE